MIPIWHFIASSILAIVLYPFFGISSLLVMLSGWLVDFDHVLYYILKFKSFNYRKAYDFYRKKRMKTKVMNIFHTVEFWTVMFVWSFFSTYILIMSIGLFVHIIMDFLHLHHVKSISVRHITLTGWIYSIITKKQKSL